MCGGEAVVDRSTLEATRGEHTDSSGDIGISLVFSHAAAAVNQHYEPMCDMIARSVKVVDMLWLETISQGTPNLVSPWPREYQVQRSAANGNSRGNQAVPFHSESLTVIHV